MANTIQVYGGNLFVIALQQYGDATLWNVIAEANGINPPDFLITGQMELIIPVLTSTSDTGGVFVPA